ncbi:MAG: DUF465 domain-containing protein [Alphaproteobacteria bacterium]|nr:MAG: DUF465 domain-containing protein [Alphaproteobacteria bacterium]TAE83036.1 MAG: DUF465 domain-containing protein [Alphaproteobacteria bacterium]TAF14989.1 MAG: DUF465 domain-containing protein [Alphaproteobacteria bacterium]TAF76635.1 MAG: DUF465 domain-containing protein [Alphaproteobacteria bacterium]
MEQENEVELYKKLDALRRSHELLEQQIHAASKNATCDEFTVSRFKKQKLAIRDQIALLQNTLYPNIIA